MISQKKKKKQVSLTPNVAVAKAYRAAGTLSGSVKKTIFRNLRNGVQRQVRYRHSDGSFSAFGESSAFSGGQVSLLHLYTVLHGMDAYGH